MPSTAITYVELTCGHRTVWVGRPGSNRRTPCPEQITCPKCFREEMVCGVECQEWHVTCRVCSFGKWCGAAEAGATHAAARHFVHKPGHECDIKWVLNAQKAATVRTNFGAMVRVRLGRHGSE